MWVGSGSEPDPGGGKGEEGSTGASSHQEFIDLKDQFEQQQVLIAQLKEMLRKTENTNVTQEKVEEYANTLTRMSARVKKNRLQRSEQGDEGTASETPASEKIMLLRQQLEENRLRLAERGKFQKGMEETVTQLKAQLDDSQQLISLTPLKPSVADTRTDYSIDTSHEELYNLLLIKDKKITELNAKVHKLEGNVLDLQENLKEKDSVIDARTKAITLMTESLSKKGKNTLDALDDTKEQMRKMQENFVTLEMEMKAEKAELVNRLEQKIALVTELQSANFTLDRSNSALQEDVKIYRSKLEEVLYASVDKETGALQDPVELSEQLNAKMAEIFALNEENAMLKTEIIKVTSHSDNLQPEVDALRNRVSELESLNAELSRLEGSPRDSPQRGKKGKKGPKGKAKEVDPQKVIDGLKDDCDKHKAKVMEHELTIQELNATVAELQAASQSAPVETEEVAKLKKQVDEGNKNMIKIKAQHKSKLKELNKKIDELKKGAAGQDGIVEQQNEITKLREAIGELEKSKEELLLKLETDSSNTERIKELEAQLFEQSELLDNKESQLKSYKTELLSLSERFNKLSQIENDQVATEMTSIHFEEQLDNLELEKKALIEKNDLIMLEKESLLEKLENLATEKQEIASKLDSYMQENMDLIDKLEKLSAEKVSSAESIEMVENLTQQEKLELEAYQQSLELNSGGAIETLDPNPELNESVNQLTEETCDLLRKIELFTEERKEVMEKMETLATENSQLNMKVQEIENNRDILSETYEQLQNEKESVEQERNTLKLLEQELNNEIAQLKKENEMLKHEIKSGSENEQVMSFETVMPLDDTKDAELQKQIDESRSLVELQKSEIKELKAELLSYKDLPVANRELHEKITTLEEQYAALKSENDNLSKTIKETSEVVQEKHVMETELTTVRSRIAEYDAKLRENLDELENYKAIIEENREELISSSNVIADLQEKVQEKQSEIGHYQNEVSHLNSVIAELNSALSHLDSENRKNNEYVDTIEAMSGQLQELKALLNENINQIEVYERELQQNSVTIGKLNTQLKELGERLLDMEHELACKDDEISKLNKERDNKEVMIVNLQDQLRQKEERFREVCESLNAKYLTLQSQIEQNAGSLSNIKDPLSKIEALETKNKEQLEKMKKIAANLKKKTTAYSELELKCKDLTQTLETREKEKQFLQESIDNHEDEIKSQMQQLQNLEEKMAAIETLLTQKSNELDERSREITTLKQNFEELQHANRDFESQLNALRTETEMQHSNESNFFNIEINEKNQIIENLNRLLESTQYQAETNTNALQAKITEMDMVVENQETEISKFKEKINKLEEFISTIEERRLSLEKQTVELNAQLLEKSNSYEEISQAEDVLERRLEALTAHDEQVQRRLHTAVVENQELTEQNQRLMEENDELKHHLSAATEKNLQSSSDQETLASLQGELSHLNEVIGRLENENKHLHENYERKLGEKAADIETLELEQQNQVEQIALERKRLITQCEQKEDELREYVEKQSLYVEDIKNYKQKLDQQQSDFEEQIKAFEKLSEEHRKNLAVMEDLDAEYRELKSKNVEFADLVRLRDEEVHKLTREMNELRSQLQQHMEINSDLAQQNSSLTDRIQGLEQKREEPKTKEPEPISTFTWSDSTTDDRFDFVKKEAVVVEPVAQDLFQAPVESENKSNDTTDDLTLKIKSLEFLLYNTEKEKEDLSVQCRQLTTEIASLIYERQAAENNRPVVCHKCRKVEAEDDLNEQIIPSENVAITEADLRQLRQVEFQPTKPCIDTPDSKIPVTEDVIPQTTAYLCFPSDSPHEESADFASSLHLDTFDDNDDGWGCGPEEAKLEEVYQQQTTPGTFNQNLNLHIEELDEKVRALEMERDRHLEEIKQLQIKSGKLIKKLKEYKSANDKLTSDIKRLDFVGLDDALQDELQSQIVHLEKRVKETSAELQKEKTEKSGLLQKVGTLQASNERMNELKEKQNVDFMMLQRRNNELTAKLEQFEWGNEGFDSPAHAKAEPASTSVDSYAAKIEELNETIKELTLDNEELQTMLEEQRLLRLNAEKTKAVEPDPANMKTEDEYLKVVAECRSLNDQLLSSLEDKKSMQEELNSLIKVKAELEIDHERLSKEKADLDVQLSQIRLTLENKERQGHENQATAQTELEEARRRILELGDQVDGLDKELQSKILRLEEVEETVRSITEEKSELARRVEERDAELSELKALCADSEGRKAGLEEVSRQVQRLTDEKGTLFEQVRLQGEELAEKSRRLDEADLERATYQSSLEKLAEEWRQRVDQRGSDVAESWKLHLEAQETEFSQVQGQLRKEISDLEEKVNILVNENNELRRNVDAEIKNEVDKMSALQQYINELTHSLQECQAKISEQERQLTESAQCYSQIQEKDSEIAELRSLQIERDDKIEELNKQLESVQRQLDEHVELKANLENELVAKEAANERLMLDTQQKDTNLSEIQNDKRILESEITTLKSQMEDKLRAVDLLTTQIKTYNANADDKDHRIADLTNQLLQLTALSDENRRQIADLLSEVDRYKQAKEALESKDSALTLQLGNLKVLINEKEKEFESLSQQYLQNESELKLHYDNQLRSKDSELEIANARLLQHAQSNEAFAEQQSQLNALVAERDELRRKLAEEEALSGEENKQLNDLRAIIEDQVLKIEEQKRELYEKSKDYDSLIAELDLRKPSVNVHQSEPVYPERESASDNPEIFEPTSRAELDLALYMLHQRDVRCEELTVELMQLLEERDTLQLKLSNAIREREELRRKYTPELLSESVSEEPLTPTKQSIPAFVELAKADDTTPLANKLSQLKSVGYRKDKTLLDEQEQRQLLQLSLMQQHREVASRLPPEAAAKLVQDASYTLSRDVQSPPKVLLNWLWGKSTPKVNEI
ncbi:protein lava lamp [Photinus pyralis]|nr:protein lava lamp [Photinus pyralis]